MDQKASIELSQEQQKAFGEIQSFQASKEERVFLLKGLAGSGKTSLVRHIIQMRREAKLNTVLLAPTGRAAMVLQQASGAAASTIHRHIYDLNVLQENQHGELVIHFSLKNQNKSPSNTLYLVDEASMISDIESPGEYVRFGSSRLLKDLIEYIQKISESKIVFVGDPAQLPPVHMNSSPALDLHYLRENFGLVGKEVFLQEVHRQQNHSSILQYSRAIREQIESVCPSPPAPPAEATDLKMCSISEMNEKLDLLSERGKNFQQVKIIAHTNQSVAEYNMAARAFFQPGAPPPQAGEPMLVTRNSYTADRTLFNGQFLMVEESQEVVEERSVRFKVRGGATQERLLRFRPLKVYDPDQAVRDVFEVFLLENVLELAYGDMDPRLQQALYVDFKNRHPKWHPKVENANKILREDPYFNALWLKYGYAITCHKAQGGQWPYCLVDLNVLVSRKAPEYYRWMYTAVTRCQEQLYLIGQPKQQHPFQVKPTVFGVNAAKKRKYLDPIHLESPTPPGCRDEMAQLIYCDWSDRLPVNWHLENVTFEQYLMMLSLRVEQELVEVQQYYGNDGPGRALVVASARTKKDVAQWLEAPGSIPFYPDLNTPHQRRMWSFIGDLCKLYHWQISSLETHPYKDVYHLYHPKDGLYRRLELNYKGNGTYTGATPYSPLPTEDPEFDQLVSNLTHWA